MRSRLPASCTFCICFPSSGLLREGFSPTPGRMTGGSPISRYRAPAPRRILSSYGLGGWGPQVRYRKRLKGTVRCVNNTFFLFVSRTVKGPRGGSFSPSRLWRIGRKIGGFSDFPVLRFYWYHHVGPSRGTRMIRNWPLSGPRGGIQGHLG